jgi:hypothetical protein
VAYEYLLRIAEPSAPSTYYYVATIGRSTTSGDTPASTYVPGGLQPLNFQLSLFDGIDPGASGYGSKGGFGSFRIKDPRGELDYLTGKVMSGGTLTLLRGTPGALYSTFTSVATLTSAGMTYDHETKEIRVRDFGWTLDVPLHDNRYGGGGGADGDATIKGIIKPYCIGQVFNVTPTLIEASKLIYQLTDSNFNTIADVRDGGVSLTFGTTRADYTAMAASAPAASHYDICVSAGLIRLGSSPANGRVTVDLTGHSTGGGTAYVKRADIANQIATRAGTTIAVNSASVTALNTAQTGTCGFFWNAEVSKRQALDEVMAGIVGYHYVNLSGELVLGYLVAPTGSAVATYTWPNDMADLPSQLEVFQDPRWKTTLGYKRNYSVQDRAQIAGAVTDANAQLYGQDAQWVTGETTSQRTYWPTSPEVKLLSGFYGSSDASTEATRQKTLFQGFPTGAILERYKIKLREDPFTLAGYLGQVISIASYTRYSWANPRKFLLIGVEFSGDATTTATLWG